MNVNSYSKIRFCGSTLVDLKQYSHKVVSAIVSVGNCRKTQKHVLQLSFYDCFLRFFNQREIIVRDTKPKRSDSLTCLRASQHFYLKVD